ncbi:MAG: DUF3365 domain-containing protein [Alphaproteobacteria bacterium]
MGLRFRFNLVLTVVFLLGLVVSGFVSYSLLQRNARDEVVRDAELMIEAARAIRSYTVDEIRPELQYQLAHTFLPQTVPAYAATTTLGRLPAEYSEYVYKEATLNPTNPRDRATDWEADLIREFQRDDELKTLTGVRSTPSGPSLYVARPLRVGNEACLACHSTPSAAPESMLALYGDSNGFGWKLNEIVGAQVVSVPMTVPVANAERAFITFMASLCAVFVVLYVVLNLMLGRMIVSPISQMSRSADEISTGNFAIPEFQEKGRDEIGRLAVSFNRMRRSLEQALKMIEK